MKLHPLTARVGIATLALGAASALAFAQAPADLTASPPSSALSPSGQPAAPATRVHRGHDLTAAQQKRLDRIASTCGLSDIQKGQIKELIILSHRRRARDWNDGERGGHRAEAMNRRVFHHELRAILTPEQFAVLRSARAARRQAQAAPSAVPAAP
jgi:Spy/CpxP family protein refolding chaperone